MLPKRLEWKALKFNRQTETTNQIETKIPNIPTLNSIFASLQELLGVTAPLPNALGKTVWPSQTLCLTSNALSWELQQIVWFHLEAQHSSTNFRLWSSIQNQRLRLFHGKFNPSWWLSFWSITSFGPCWQRGKRKYLSSISLGPKPGLANPSQHGMLFQTCNPIFENPPQNIKFTKVIVW